MRAGRYVKQIEGYRAFIPAPLPPDPPLVMDTELIRLLSEADRSLGRLDGVTSVLPNPDLFVAMYVRHEAVLSSQIEGTQSTLEDVLQFEIDVKGHDRPKDVEEVVNYVHAMNYGLECLKDLPLACGSSVKFMPSSSRECVAVTERLESFVEAKTGSAIPCSRRGIVPRINSSPSDNLSFSAAAHQVAVLSGCRF